MKKEEIEAKYKECYKYFADAHNAQPIDIRTIGAAFDNIVTVREGLLYLNQYGDLIPPKLKCVMHSRITGAKKRVIELYNDIER